MILVRFVLTSLKINPRVDFEEVWWLLQDFIQALDIVDVAMKDSIRKLSSFDRYKGEVLSGNLDWTPMHKDPVFWRDNITKFADNDFQVNFTLSLFYKLYLMGF